MPTKDCARAGEGHGHQEGPGLDCGDQTGRGFGWAANPHDATDVHC